MSRLSMLVCLKKCGRLGCISNMARVAMLVCLKDIENQYK